MAALAVATAAAQAALVVGSGQPYSGLLAAYPLVGLLTVSAGVWLWDLRPWNRSGLLLVVTGIEILLSSAGNVPDPWIQLVGNLAAEVPIAGFTHLVLAFPSGRVSAGGRWLVAAVYANSLVLQIPIVLLSGVTPPVAWLTVMPRVELAAALDDTQGWVGNALIVLAAALLLRRLRSNPVPTERAALTVTHAYHLFTLASFPVTSRILRPALDWSPYTLFAVQLTIMAGLPLATAFAILGRALRRTMGMVELSAIVGGGDVSPLGVRDALAAALDDPSLQLLHSTADGSFADLAGRPVSRPDHDPDRGVIVVQGPGPGRSAIVYDRHLIGDTAVVEEAGGLAALALDYGRLNGELLATQEELRDSRLRIVEAADQERLRIARDLHDGVQSRLVNAALRAGLGAAGTEAEARQAVRNLASELDRAVTDLRRLVHGIMPALLVERGLFAALEELVADLPVPAALEVEDQPLLARSTATAAYLITAEALTNVVKHAGATRAEVTVGVDRLPWAWSDGAPDALRISVRDNGRGGADPAGSGLRGMADRAEALGGQLLVTSEPGRGTDVIVRLPCGS